MPPRPRSAAVSPGPPTGNDGRGLEALADAYALFPPLAGLLGSAAAEEALLSGPAVHEIVAKGARLDLDDGFEAMLALTLWRLDPPGPVARLAEISYTVKLDDGSMTGAAARQALALFRRVQEQRDADLAHPSKTRLTLPAAGTARATALAAAANST